MPYYVNSTYDDQPELAGFAPSFGEGLRAAFGSMTAENPVSLIWDAGRFRQANAVDKARLSVDDATQRFKDAGITEKVPASGYTLEAVEMLIERRREQAALQSVRDRTPWSWIGSPIRGAAMLFAGSMDPLNVLSAFIFPVVGQARFARMMQTAGTGALARAGVRAQVGAVEGAAGALMMEPFVYGMHAELADQYTMADSLMNVAFGATLGAALHVGAGVARDAVSRPVLTPAGARVVGDGEPRPVAFARVAETMDADTRMAAFRIALTDMVEGRTPDVHPLFDAIGMPSIGPEALARLEVLHAERADLLGVAGNAAEAREIAAIRQELALMEQRRPPSDEAAIRAVAKEIQAQDRVSYKKALSEANKRIADQAADFAATTTRLQQRIEQNAKAAQAAQRLAEIDAQIKALEQPDFPTQAPQLSPLAVAARGAIGENRARVAFDSAVAARVPADVPVREVPPEPKDATAHITQQMQEAVDQLAVTVKALEARGVNVKADLAQWDDAVTRAERIGKGLEAMVACRIGS